MMEALPVINEPKLTSYLFSKASKAKMPLNGTFELSPVCNFSCHMCYVRKTAKEVAAHDRPMMTLDQWIDVAKEAQKAGMLYLLLTGGEPFLWPDFWKLYERLSQMGLLISINTNGSLIDDAVVERLKKMPPTRINITLYGASDAAYHRLCGADRVFSQVDRAITKLKAAGINVKLNGSLTPDNISDFESCCEYGTNHGVIYEPNTYMYPPIRRDAAMVGKNERFTPKEAAFYKLNAYQKQYGDQAYKKFLNAIIHHYVEPPGLDDRCIDSKDGKILCRAGSASFWVTWDGWLTPCGMMPEPKVEMRGRSFTEAWHDLVCESEKLKLSGVCRDCPDRKLCHSCAAMAMAETGEASGIPTYLCEMVRNMKEIASETLEKWND